MSNPQKKYTTGHVSIPLQGAFHRSPQRFQQLHFARFPRGFSAGFSGAEEGSPPARGVPLIDKALGVTKILKNPDENMWVMWFFWVFAVSFKEGKPRQIMAGEGYVLIFSECNIGLLGRGYLF